MLVLRYRLGIFLWLMMPSLRTLQHRQAAEEIANSGHEMAPCNHCRSARILKDEPKVSCIVGPRLTSCSECIKKGYKDCDVTLSAPKWTRLQDLRERLRKEAEEADEEEVKLLHEQSELQRKYALARRQEEREQQDILRRLFEQKAKRIRLGKQLRLASDRTDAAVAKEILDMDEAEAVKDTAFPASSSAGIENETGPSATWGSQDWLAFDNSFFPLDYEAILALPRGTS